MKILMLSPRVPSPTSGASNRIYQLLKALSKRHQISLLAFDNGSDADLHRALSDLKAFVFAVELIELHPALSKRWNQLLGLLRGTPAILTSLVQPAMQRAVDAHFAQQRFDILVFESVLIAGYRIPDGVKVIIDQHNLEYEIRLRTYQHEKNLVRKWYNRLEGRSLQRIEIARCQNAHAVVVTSERERKALQVCLPEAHIAVVPNGIDEIAFIPRGAEQEVAHRVVFTGAMDYYPNVDAVSYFARHCWPIIRECIPVATWQIIGKNPLPQVTKLAALPGVQVIGTVPDTSPYLASASVAVVPLRIGSGTRLKILEALAMGKAVVSTSIGCEGLSVESHEHLLVIDEPVAFARAVVDLLRDKEKRQALGSAGRTLVERYYRWDDCSQSLLRIVEACSS